jgi:hypothetical protein
MIIDSYHLENEIDEDWILYSEDIFNLNFENLGLNLEMLNIKKS